AVGTEYRRKHMIRVPLQSNGVPAHLRIPKPGCAVTTSTGQALTIGTECEPEDLIRMSGEGRDRFLEPRIPELDLAVGTRAGNTAAILAEAHSKGLTVVASERDKLLGALALPQPDR